MTYIVCAFEAEARALIDSYRLIKHETRPFAVFGNDKIHLIISGMGQAKAKEAAQYLLSRQSIQKEDIFINIGICAAQQSYKVGELLIIKSIHNEETSHLLSTPTSPIKEVSCFSAGTAQEHSTQTDIAEMEALGLYETLKENFLPENMSFLKVVSDNFQPFIPKKKFIIDLIQARLKEIKTHIKTLQGDCLVR